MEQRSPKALIVSAPLPAIDRQIARALSGQISEKHRLAFAQAFTFAVLRACQQHLALSQALDPPAAMKLMSLTYEAEEAAGSLGAALAKLEPRAANYLTGVIYTTALPEAYRAAHGIFYTPPSLVDRLLTMAENAGVDWATARVLDPACGGGAFLVPVALRIMRALAGANPNFILQQIGVRLRGFELDPFGAWLAQASLEIALQPLIKATGRTAPALVDVKDSLAMDPDDSERFDLVIGNPPYGRITPPPMRRAMFKRSIYGHANLYGLFTDAALRWAKRGGVIGYVTPTSMLSGLYYKALRGLLAQEAPPIAVNFVSERAGVFADVLQETILATYRRAGRSRTGKVGFIAIDEAGNAAFHKAGAFTLPMHADAPWLLPRIPQQVSLTRRLRAMPHRLADYGYGVSTGPLVWNRFKDQFQQEQKVGSFPVVWAESVTTNGRFIWRAERRNHAPWFAARLPKDQWLIVKQPCVLLQRTTAKEQPRRLIAAELSSAFIARYKGVIVENHLNMVRAIVPEPLVPAAVIAALLNSAAVDAAFRCVNGSVAVSAFELEELPLPSPAVMAKLTSLIAEDALPEVIEATIAEAYKRTDASAA